MFSIDDIQARIRTRPFVPLRIVTSSGQTYDVHHPDLIMVGKRYLLVGVPSADNPGVFEQHSQVAVMHVSDLQPVPAQASSGGNGPTQTPH